jgi:hypothetical protein
MENALAFMKKGRAFSTFEKKGRALCPAKTLYLKHYSIVHVHTARAHTKHLSSPN